MDQESYHLPSNEHCFLIYKKPDKTQSSLILSIDSSVSPAKIYRKVVEDFVIQADCGDFVVATNDKGEIATVDVKTGKVMKRHRFPGNSKFETPTVLSVVHLDCGYFMARVGTGIPKENYGGFLERQSEGYPCLVFFDKNLELILDQPCSNHEHPHVMKEGNHIVLVCNKLIIVFNKEGSTIEHFSTFEFAGNASGACLLKNTVLVAGRTLLLLYDFDGKVVGAFGGMWTDFVFCHYDTHKERLYLSCAATIYCFDVSGM